MILAPQGNLVGKPETVELEQTLAEALARGDRKIIIDLSGVRYANSTGLGALVIAHLKADEVRGAVVLCGVSPRIQQVLQITRLLGVFTITETEEEGVARLGESG